MKSAIVLAAGKGRKVAPYDLTRQKCALPVGNDAIIRRLVRQLKRAGIERIVVVVGPWAGQVREALSRYPEVLYVHQPQPEGTAPGVLLGLGQIPSGEDFLVVYGDMVFSEKEIPSLLGAHREGDSAVTLLAQRITPPLDPRDWMGAQIDQNRVLEIEGHPREASHRLCGLFAFDRRAIPYLERNPGLMRNVPVGGMPPMEAPLEQSLQMMIESGETISAVEAEGFVIDVDKPWHLLEASQAIAEEWFLQTEENRIPPSARIDDSAEIKGRLVLGEEVVIGKRVVVEGLLVAGKGTRIENGAILRGKVIIGRDCRVRDYCLLGNAVLGHRCIVGHGAEFEGVAFNKVYLYHYCEVLGVLGEAVDIGAATVCGTLRFDDRETIHRIGGRREIPPIGANASYLGDFCRTGVNAILMPGCKVGAYSVIGPGVILYEDVPPRTMILARQELEHKEWGPERYGW